MKEFNFFSLFIVLILIISCDTSNNSTEDINNAIQFARDYSSTKSQRDWSDAYWDNICIDAFITVDCYNYIMELNKTPELKYVDEADYWSWANDSLQVEFSKMREKLK